MQSLEQGVVTHHLTEVDVVALVDGSERGRDHDSYIRPSFTLGRGLPAGTGALALPRDDHLEAAVHQCPGLEHPLSLVHQAGVGVLGDFLRVVVEADPGGGDRVGVDVVE